MYPHNTTSFINLVFFHYVKPPELKKLDDVIQGTTKDNPYDATRAGPMCEQGNRDPEGVANLNEVNINDAVDKILEVILF